MNKFNLKNGGCTVYAFFCGYGDVISNNDFDFIITTLGNNYLGDDIHQQWVEYTELMESIRGNSILELVPQLTSELKRNVR
jgi:hypothetical protein